MTLSSQFIYVSIFIFNKTSSDCFQLTQGSQTQILHFFLHFTNSTEVKDTAQREVHRGQFIFVWNMQKKWVCCVDGVNLSPISCVNISKSLIWLLEKVTAHNLFAKILINVNACGSEAVVYVYMSF